MEPLNDRFRLVNRRIDVVQPDIFLRTRSAMLEMFLLMAQRENIRVRVTTIRALRDTVHLIDEEFRQNPENCRLFLRILKAPYTVVTQLTRMCGATYSAVSASLWRHCGSVQRDLFHIYTVDAHTMMVIRNMRLSIRTCAGYFSHRPSMRQKYPKGELLYIAGLFHDIGKGA